MSVPIIPTNTAPYSALPSTNSLLFEAKARKGLTFSEIAKALKKDEVWVAAAFYGQAKFDHEDLTHLAVILGFQSSDALEAGLGDHWWPSRGLGPVPPTDPLIYRLYEGVLVYGHAIKAVLHEKFGSDGIMSMVDCKISVERKENRALLTFDGKFLPYAKW